MLPALLLVLVTSPLALMVADPAPLPCQPGLQPDPELHPPQIILGTQVAPTYPPAARDARIAGMVTLDVNISAEGKVGDVKVIGCTHRKVGFEQASVRAVKSWRFTPALKNGEPVPFVARYRLNFRQPSRYEDDPHVTGTNPTGSSSHSGPQGK